VLQALMLGAHAGLEPCISRLEPCIEHTFLQMAMRMAEAATEAAVARVASSLGGSESSSSGRSNGDGGSFRSRTAASRAEEQQQAVAAQPSFTSLEQLPSDLDAYDLGSSAAGMDSLAGDEVADVHGAAGDASDGSVF
jgi:hypothetical protein